MTGRLGVGVIGLGFGGRVHVPAFQALAETSVVAVCSTRRERAAAVAARHGVPVIYTDYHDLLADPRVEAVSIATPPALHHPMAVAAMLAGKHVLVEKPMARTVAEARDMVRQAEAAGIVHMVGHELRFLPARQRLKALIDEGYLGQAHSISVTIFRPMPAGSRARARGWMLDRDQGGGMLGAIGAHVIDALLWWFGPIAGVTGRLATMVSDQSDPAIGHRRPVTADDTCVCLIEFATGALGTIHLSGVAWHGSGEHLEVYGSAGALALTAAGVLLGGRQGEPCVSEVPVTAPADLTVPDKSPPQLLPFMRLARQFARATRGGDRPASDFFAGLRVQEVLGGIQKSARDGQWVSFGRGWRS